MPKLRLDERLLELQLADSIRRAASEILSANVLVNDRLVTTVGALVDRSDHIRLKKTRIPYVSRGGMKLAGAHCAFNFLIHNRVCIDIGQSTGGFTDYLLQHGARSVLGIDVGYGLLAHAIRRNPAVHLLERFNVKEFSYDAYPESFTLKDKVSLVVIDVSFISIVRVLSACLFLPMDTEFICLIKPQFESKKDEIPPGGVITDPTLHATILERTVDRITALGYTVNKQTPSPILGAKGNKEFFFYLKRN